MIRTAAQVSHQIVHLLMTEFIREEWRPEILDYVGQHFDEDGKFEKAPDAADQAIRTLECRDCPSDETGVCPVDCPVKPYRDIMKVNP